MLRGRNSPDIPSAGVVELHEAVVREPHVDLAGNVEFAVEPGDFGDTFRFFSDLFRDRADPVVPRAV